MDRWTNQSIVMRADAIDNTTYAMYGEKKIPPLDYYGKSVNCFWHIGKQLLN